MKTHTRITAALVSILSLATPALALAQSTTSPTEADFIRNRLNAIADDMARMGSGSWRGSQRLGEQIGLLAKEVVQNIPLPVLLGVEMSSLTRNFGDPRGDGTRSHEGLDIMAPRGTPVVSPTDAVITRIGDGASSGLTVSTANPGGERFVYMHLESFGEGLSEGMILKPGDLIGYVGNTGNASGGAPHLHFEIRKDGATDPFPRITRTFTEAERATAVGKIVTTTQNANAKSILSSYVARTAPAIVTPQVQTTQPVGVTIIGTRNLKRGMTGEDVRALQIYLNAHGFIVAASGSGSVGNETTYFGPATEAAVIAYQKSKAIVPAVGYFGPITRASMGVV